MGSPKDAFSKSVHEMSVLHCKNDLRSKVGSDYIRVGRFVRRPCDWSPGPGRPESSDPPEVIPLAAATITQSTAFGGSLMSEANRFRNSCGAHATSGSESGWRRPWGVRCWSVRRSFR